MDPSDKVVPFFSFLAGLFLVRKEINYSELSYIMNDFTSKTNIYIDDDCGDFNLMNDFVYFNDKKLYIINNYNDIIYVNNSRITFGDYLYDMTTCEIRDYFGIPPRNKFKLFKNKIKAKVS